MSLFLSCEQLIIQEAFLKCLSRHPLAKKPRSG
jgi:hypothetical protein